MIPRYTTPEMHTLWSDGMRLSVWFDVEVAALAAWERRGRVPVGVAARLRQKKSHIDFAALAERAAVIEETTRHDVIAFLSALEEHLGEDSRAIHYGMTSSDVVDTAFAILLRDAGRQIVARASTLVDAFRVRAEEHRQTICLGRTHGQAAEPTSFGLKLLAIAAEIDRGRRRVAAAVNEIATGKLSGAVGNFGNIDPAIEAEVMADLGLAAEPVSTQVVPRDRHAAFFASLAILAGSVERFAVEVRHLMRSEVAEAFEPFGKGQRGSSAMPHKKNPILTENVTGLCRLVRSYAGASFENQALWHERDISHSSVERVIGPDATTTMDFALQRSIGVIKGLVVDAERMRMHLDAAGGLTNSESVLLALVDTGVLRQEAYGWVQAAAMKSRDGSVTFLDALTTTPEIAARVPRATLAALFDPAHHLRHVDAVFERVNKAFAAPL